MNDNSRIFCFIHGFGRFMGYAAHKHTYSYTYGYYCMPGINSNNNEKKLCKTLTQNERTD